jgi:hypothetical protein
MLGQTLELVVVFICASTDILCLFLNRFQAVRFSKLPDIDFFSKLILLANLLMHEELGDVWMVVIA